MFVADLVEDPPELKLRSLHLRGLGAFDFQPFFIGLAKVGMCVDTHVRILAATIVLIGAEADGPIRMNAACPKRRRRAGLSLLPYA